MIFSKKICSLATYFCTLFLTANIVSANDPNLIGHWTFDEGSGFVVADVISGNNGTLMKGAYNPSMTARG